VLAVADVPDLEGEVAVVTGASSGIGRRIAQLFHDAGATVVLVGRDRGRLGSALPAGPRAVAIPADLTDEEQLMAMADRVLAAHEAVTILVNAAGTCVPCSLDDVTSDLLYRGWLIHLRAPVLLAQRFAPGMAEAGYGSIVNISSVLAGHGHPDRVDYASAKGALEAATRALAAELGPRQIRVNAIAPGITRTRMTERFLENPRRRDAYVETVPLRRAGSVNDVARTAVFLAGPAGAYITGQCLSVDSGWSVAGGAFDQSPTVTPPTPTGTSVSQVT
jgi:NAD(P)-dependent dehydrogenase (short-subunit alcohol dehydrogenase family)